jgi:trimethylamine:corrinoid methyltransferase-like protein
MYKEYFRPKLSNKDSFSDWKKNAKGQDIIARAKEELDKMLQNNKSPVEKEIIKEISDFQSKLIKFSAKGYSAVRSETEVRE